MNRRRLLPAAVAIAVATGLWLFDIREKNNAPPPVAPNQPAPPPAKLPTDTDSSITIGDLLAQADRSMAAMRENLSDYTATLVKQQRGDDGNLEPQSRIEMKVQTRLRNDNNDAPKRVYLRFLAPENVAGREVIWGEDLYDGQMAVHETSFLLSLQTLWLDPTGMIAMRGQRYPIWEIGLVRLAEKLIDRGGRLRDDPHIRVTLDRNVQFEGQTVRRYRLIRDRPAENRDDDFAAAEVIIDAARDLILQYRSFDWPDDKKDEPHDATQIEQLPLIETYTYQNVQTGVGLTDSDFDVKNPAYQFP